MFDSVVCTTREIPVPLPATCDADIVMRSATGGCTQKRVVSEMVSHTNYMADPVGRGPTQSRHFVPSTNLDDQSVETRS
jgi:hypothetical protein